MYEIQNTRSNLTYSISLLSRFLIKLKTIYINIIKKVLRYIYGTFNYDLKFFRIENLESIFYTNLDFASSILQDEIKLISDYIEYLTNVLIIWFLKR